jgi:hypothetical protein
MYAGEKKISNMSCCALSAPCSVKIKLEAKANEEARVRS